MPKANVRVTFGPESFELDITYTDIEDLKTQAIGRVLHSCNYGIEVNGAAQIEDKLYVAMEIQPVKITGREP